MKIILENVSKRFDDNYVIKNASLNLEKGKIYGFIGRNGSGKTVLLNIICGFIRPSEGVVLIDNVDIYKTNTFPKSTRALIEKPKFLCHLSGYKNLELLASINNTIGPKEIEATLKDVNLYEEKDKQYSKYSMGMKQKLGIAQVLMENPDILIFDEPFNGLEEGSVQKIRDLLLNEKRRGKLIIIATHLKEDVQILCDKVYKIDGGIIVES